MIVWGISANSHDAALAVFKNQELVFASHSERFSGIKNDPDLNYGLISYALQWGEPDKVIWYEKPVWKTLRQIKAGQGIRWQENNIRNYLRKYNITCPIEYNSHHQSHASAGYFTSTFKDASIICIDSIGEFETLSIWQGNGDKLRKIYSQIYPHSLGLWYSAMTQRVGLTPNEDEYILMGMSAYGDPYKYKSHILNDFFTSINGPSVKFKQNLHRGCRSWMPELVTDQDMYDIAAATQNIYEEIFDLILCYTSTHLSSKNLVLSGGCALNCSANSLAYKYFNNVWIMPNPGDAGSAIGSVLGYWNKHINWKGPFLGYDIKKPYPVNDIINDLKINKITGVANGKAEFGPRALGNRSLLADPRGKEIKDLVNNIKQRQKFRPFAPAILEEYADQYFEGVVGPYMQYTAICRRPDLFPAIAHVDGTSRVQTVSEKDNPEFYKLLLKWFDKTGCPMLLNTSLNIKGHPMVNTEQDAKRFAQYYGVNVFS